MLCCIVGYLIGVTVYGSIYLGQSLDCCMSELATNSLILDKKGREDYALVGQLWNIDVHVYEND